MQDLLKQFESYLGQHSLKLTQERSLIFEHIMSTDGHFDAEMLISGIRSNKLRISRDTVFRNLPLMLESGVIQKSVGKGKGEYYERLCPNDGHHDHMICLRCGIFLEFFSKKIEKAQSEVCKGKKFQLVHHDHRLFGYCESCRES